MIVRLFSYGTLQLPAVQRIVFGRTLDGKPDKLPGYALEPLVITDAKVIETSGKAVHTIARPTGRLSDTVEGVVFKIGEAGKIKFEFRTASHRADGRQIFQAEGGVVGFFDEIFASVR